MFPSVRNQRLINDVWFQVAESHASFVIECHIDRNPAARTENPQVNKLIITGLYGKVYFILPEIISCHILDIAVSEQSRDFFISCDSGERFFLHAETVAIDFSFFSAVCPRICSGSFELIETELYKLSGRIT